MIEVKNPILPGFNADPSAIRVNGDYYVVTSTFNWSYGVALYHSRDLKNWKQIGNILDRTEQLNMRGNPDSCGIWAPQISYNEKRALFILTYTDVKSLSDSFFDLNNYLVTSKDIEGPWSKPVHLNSSGFDPSIFHDDDGKSYLLNLAWEFRDNYPHPGPIIIQELDLEAYELVGSSKVIYRGNPNFGCTEGPHLIKKSGYYYLLTAEGGTGYGHAVTISRSKSIFGPYKESPDGPLLTSRKDINPVLQEEDTDFLKPQFYNPDISIQKAGHGSIIDTAEGEFVLFHLSARPVMPQMRCILNRETSLQKVIWDSDWPRLSHGDAYPRVNVGFNLTEYSEVDVTEPGKIIFNKMSLPVNFYSLKDIRSENWCSLKRKKGVLSIKGRNSPYSSHDYSLIARRVQHFNCDIETELSFDPENIRQMAGLVIQTGSRTFYFIRYFFSESLNSTAIDIMISSNGKLRRDGCIKVTKNEELNFRLSLRRSELTFFYSMDRVNFIQVGNTYDATLLSDEFTNSGPGAFDGTFVGMSVCDMDRQKKWAEFTSFSYIPK